MKSIATRKLRKNTIPRLGYYLFFAGLSSTIYYGFLSNKIGLILSSFATFVVLFYINYLKSTRLGLNTRNILYLILGLGFWAIYLNLILEDKEEMVAISQLIMAIEMQLIFYVFRAKIGKFLFLEIKAKPIFLILLVGLTFIYLTFDQLSLPLTILILFRVVQTAIFASIGFVLWEKNKAILIAAIAYILFHFLSGVFYFHSKIPFHMAVTFPSILVSHLFLILGITNANSRNRH